MFSATKTTFAPLATAVSYMLDPPVLEEPFTKVSTSDKSLRSASQTKTNQAGQAKAGTAAQAQRLMDRFDQDQQRAAAPAADKTTGSVRGLQ